jgi:hypothetical protein
VDISPNTRWRRRLLPRRGIIRYTIGCRRFERDAGPFLIKRMLYCLANIL